MFYLINKPKGISSFKAIKNFANENNILKIGHTGTLDPLASGLLLVATDDDTKLIEFVDKSFKTYKVTFELGKISNTYDSDGNIENILIKIPGEDEVKKTLMKFVGKQLQRPPIFSAKKINGKKAYDLARNGIDFVLKDVEIEIKSVSDFLKISENIFSFNIVVSRGTYIRSIIHDLGQKLKCGAIMIDLERIFIGNYSMDDLNKKISIFELLTIPVIELNNLMVDIKNGKVISIDYEDGLYALKFKDDIFGVVKILNKKLFVKKILGNKFKKEGF